MDGMGCVCGDSESESRLPSLDIPPQLASMKPRTAKTKSLNAHAFDGAPPGSEIIIQPLANAVEKQCCSSSFALPAASPAPIPLRRSFSLG
jgi:hypothetical protein